MSDVVQKLWGFCHTLRHDGIDYGDYIEQLTYLLFLKMAEEKGVAIPKQYSWSVLREKAGTDLTDFYIDLLRGLGKQSGTLGNIYTKAISKFTNPVNLKKLVNLIDEIEWTALNVDVKAAAYEGLLEKSASEGKKGAGQYFTPRILIQSIVRCMKPDPRKTKDFTIHDPATGTGGFLVCAYEWLIEQTKGGLEREDAKRILNKTYSGTELVERPRRLCLMNLYLHGINGKIYLGDSIYEPPKNGHYDCILTNPPFGTKGANQAPVRDDFTVSTSNKQLNFVQHIMSILKPGGRAAVVLPDNVLFEEHAARDIFEILMEDCNLHTILRLPNGTFAPYSQGVKANVIFFTKGIKTEKVWIYDNRTNVPAITKKDRPLTPEHFTDFEKCFGTDPNGHPQKAREESERFKCFTREEIKKRKNNMDITWLKEENLDGDEIREPEELVTDVAISLKSALTEIEKITLELPKAFRGELTKQDPNDEPASVLLKRIKKEQQKLHGKKYKEPESVDTTDLPELPEGWEWACLGSIIASAQAGFASGEKDVKNGLFHLRMNNIDSKCNINLELVRTVPQQLGLEKYLLEKGDVLICHTNSQKLIGKTTLFNLDGKYAFSNHLTRIRFFNNTIDSEYIWHYISTLWRQGYFEDKCKQWVNQATIERETLLSIPIPIPPLTEQRLIIKNIRKFFTRLDEIAKFIKIAHTHCDKMAQSILSKTFRGELVHQDSADEPDSIL